MRTLQICLGLKPFIPMEGITRTFKSKEMDEPKSIYTNPDYAGQSPKSISLTLRNRILNLFDSGKGYTNAELADLVNASMSATRIHLISLTSKGTIERTYQGWNKPHKFKKVIQ